MCTSDNNSMQHSIYKIDIKRLHNTKIKRNKDNKIEGEVKQELCKLMTSNKDKNNCVYSYCDLITDNLISGINGLFMYKITRSNVDEINNFLSSAIASALKLQPSNVYSTILFLWNDMNIYAITTGYARFDISKYIEPHFGLNFIGKYKNNINVRSQSINPLHGLIHEDSQKFASPVPVSHIMTSNSLINKISGFIDDKNSAIYKELPTLKNKKVYIYARDHIRLSSKFTFNELQEMLQSIDACQKYEEPFNSINLEDEDVCELIEKNISEGKYVDDIYVYPKNDEDFDTSNEWIIKCKEIAPVKAQNLGGLYREYKEKTAYEEGIKTFLQEAFIEFKNESGKKQRLLETLNGELKKNDQLYSLIYGRLYGFSENINARINNDLANRLQCNEINSDCVIGNVKLNDIKDEDDIIIRICSDPKLVAYPLHKIICSNVEFADIHIETENEIYIVHVKLEFNNSMRVLQKQMELSAQTWIDCKFDSKNKIMSELSDKICGDNPQSQESDKGKDDNKCEVTKDNIKTYEEYRAEKCEELVNRIKPCATYGEYLRKCKNITYVALIGTKKKITNYTSSTSITAKICLERLIAFFTNEGVSIKIANFIYTKKMIKK